MLFLEYPLIHPLNSSSSNLNGHPITEKINPEMQTTGLGCRSDGRMVPSMHEPLGLASSAI